MKYRGEAHDQRLGPCQCSTRNVQETSELSATRDDAARGTAIEEIVGTSAAIRTVLEEVDRVAATDATVMVYGETGTGKELIARVHSSPQRARERTAREHQLRRHTRRAAGERAVRTRARRVHGRAEPPRRALRARQDGTLFLDEVGEMALDMQPKLLRLLQEREFERVGQLEDPAQQRGAWSPPPTAIWAPWFMTERFGKTCTTA